MMPIHADPDEIILDSYITIVPSGLETFAIQSIKIALVNYRCDVKKLSSSLISDEVRNLKNQILQQRIKRKAKKKAKAHLLHSLKVYDEEIFGTAKLVESKKEVNVGFHKGETVISTPGSFEGKSVVQFHTNAPPRIVAGIRAMGCGPLLAMVVSSCNDDEKPQQLLLMTQQTVDEASKAIASYVKDGSNSYHERFDAALDLWARHAREVWFESDDLLHHQAMNGKKRTRDDSIKSEDDIVSVKTSLLNALRMKKKRDLEYKYRISCIRAYSTDYKYKRDDLIPSLANVLIPTHKLNDGRPMFTVDLKGYDFEMLAMINKNSVTVAIPLNYYQYVNARSYSSGKIPPDITAPYITGEISKTVIRLRPSIANLLYHVAGISKGDIIMDPCAGVGTILVEGSFRSSFSLGGDLILDGKDNNLDHIVQSYLKNARRWQVKNRKSGSAEILSWDAALLPIREESVDCIISDLPFGQKCMSTSKLEAFFPLLFSECARCLRKKTGRMILLCGSFQCVLEALAKSEAESLLFDVPDCVMPVNIGGLSAWVIRVKRNDSDFIPLKNHKERFSKMTRGRLQSMKGRKRAQA